MMLLAHRIVDDNIMPLEYRHSGIQTLGMVRTGERNEALGEGVAQYASSIQLGS